MKLPRWLVISMLTSSVLAVLTTAGWWWVTWPERTFHDFKSLMAEGRFGEATAMISKPEGKITGSVVFSGQFWKEFDVEELLTLESPSFVELIVGRRTCMFKPDFILTIQCSRISAKDFEGGALRPES